MWGFCKKCPPVDTPETGPQTKDLGLGSAVGGCPIRRTLSGTPTDKNHRTARISLDLLSAETVAVSTWVASIPDEAHGDWDIGTASVIVTERLIS